MLKINVGMSRKVTEDYNSKGFSLNIEGELPSDVLSDQKTLTESTNRLFALANLMLDEQVRKATVPAPDIRTERAGHVGNGNNGNGNGRTYARAANEGADHQNGDNGHPRNAPQNGERLLTQAQFRAITTMSRKLNQDADELAHGEFGVDKLADLTVKQASKTIDYLKQGIDTAANGGGR